jgi:hypothetical protein
MQRMHLNLPLPRDLNATYAFKSASAKHAKLTT